jgi:hypothetical protein
MTETQRGMAATEQPSERLRTLQRELKQLRHRLEEKSQRFRLLLDQASDDAEPPP